MIKDFIHAHAVRGAACGYFLRRRTSKQRKMRTNGCVCLHLQGPALLQNTSYVILLTKFVHTAMALYINGRPVNPIVQFLVSAVVLAAVVGIGILLLPVIGGILLFVLICVAALALYGVYWRWRHGDPLENLRKRMQEEMRAQEDAEDRVAEARAPEEGLKPGDKAQAGVKRTTVVEDAVVVEEIKRIPRDTQQ